MTNPYHLQIITRQAEQGCWQSARALEEYERTGVLGEPPLLGQRAGGETHRMFTIGHFTPLRKQPLS